MWKGDTIESPTEQPIPEGSVKNPEHGHARDSNVRLETVTNATNTSSDVYDQQDSERQEPQDVLWNNQYAALRDDWGDVPNSGETVGTSARPTISRTGFTEEPA